MSWKGTVNAVSSPLIPWLPSNLPTEIQDELNRRKTARGLNFIRNNSSWTGDDWKDYKGPMASWARVCSNGLGRTTPATKGLPFEKQEFKYPGFVMAGGEGFYSIYGFGKPTRPDADGAAILGYTPKGTPHSLDYDLKSSNYPIHVPTPEINKIEATIQKELYRRVNIHWTCFSLKQLEYMTPYFLVPGISVIIEWGWNHFNPNSLLDLTNIDELANHWDNPYPLYTDNILDSKGNYDVTFGIISNFEWSMEGQVIKCNTEVTSKDRMYAGISSNSVSSDQKSTAATPEITDLKPENLPDWKANLMVICGPDSGFMNSLVNISTCANLEDVQLGSTGGGTDLKALCKRLSAEGKESYWRGVFCGRPEQSKYTKDFDYQKATKPSGVWVNMGFLVELMNYCVPIKSITDQKRSFFQVDVDDCIIGGHPNLISINGSVLLIPNAVAPRYNYNGIMSSNSAEENIRLNQFAPTTKIGTEPPPEGGKWYADYQLSKVFKHGLHPRRQNLNEFINLNRLHLTTEENHFAFPFTFNKKVRGLDAVEYKHGFFKDLYFNLDEFLKIVGSSGKSKTYTDIYEEIFAKTTSAARNFWEFSLVESTGQQDPTGAPAMKIVDSRMIPLKNGNDRPYFFNYGESDSIIQSFAFKPTLTTAQATRTMFSETNNKDSRMVVTSDSDLLDFQSKDRILVRKYEKGPSELVVRNKNSKGEEQTSMEKRRDELQSLTSPPDGSLPMTIDRNGKLEYVRLALPDSGFLSLLLNDEDLDNNSRYLGVQPNITAEMRLLGIGGIRTFQMFLVRGLPEPYSEENVIFRVTDVTHELENGNWTTLIRAGILPLRGAVKKALNFPPKA